VSEANEARKLRGKKREGWEVREWDWERERRAGREITFFVNFFRRQAFSLPQRAPSPNVVLIFSKKN